MSEVIKLLNTVIFAVQRMFFVLFSQYCVQVFFFSFLNNVYKFLLYSKVCIDSFHTLDLDLFVIYIVQSMVNKSTKMIF